MGIDYGYFFVICIRLYRMLPSNDSRLAHTANFITHQEIFVKTLFAPGQATALNLPLSRLESALLLAVLLALLLAGFGPAVAQHAQYLAFADQRSW